MPRRGERTVKLIPGDRSDPLGFPVLVEEYLEFLAVHGYSPKTVENRRYNLTYLVIWLGDRGVSRPGEVTKPMLDRYQRAVFHHRKPDGQPLSFRSQVQRLTPVRALFKWLARENRILYNPASELELPKAERRLPRAVLTQGEAERVLAVPDLADQLGLRDRAMLELFYATGLRRSELAHLRVFDLDIERLTLAVRQGKGRKDRMIPTGERAAVWAARYLNDVRPRLAVEPDDGTLFLTVDGTAFSPDRLTGLVADYVKRSGVGKPGACHLFRHTMATLMLEGGADIRFHSADARTRRHLNHPDLHPSLPQAAPRDPCRDPPRRYEHATPATRQRPQRGGYPPGWLSSCSWLPSREPLSSTKCEIPSINIRATRRPPHSPSLLFVARRSPRQASPPGLNATTTDVAPLPAPKSCSHSFTLVNTPARFRSEPLFPAPANRCHGRPSAPASPDLMHPVLSPTTRTPPAVLRGGRVVGLRTQGKPQCWRGRTALEVHYPATHLITHFATHQSDL